MIRNRNGGKVWNRLVFLSRTDNSPWSYLGYRCLVSQQSILFCAAHEETWGRMAGIFLWHIKWYIQERGAVIRQIGMVYIGGGGWIGSKFPDQMIWMVGQCTGAVAAPVLWSGIRAIYGVWDRHGIKTTGFRWNSIVQGHCISILKS